MIALGASSPRGQSLVEMVFVLMIISLLLITVSWIGVWGMVAHQTAHGARVAAFDCDMRPGHCTGTAHSTERNLRARLLASDRREVFAVDLQRLIRYRTAESQGQIFEKADDLRLFVDHPAVDGADKNLLSKLADTFRQFTMKAGPAVFGLTNPDRLTRTTVRATLFSSRAKTVTDGRLPRLDFQSRIALITDGWAAVDAPDFYGKVRAGEHPSSFLDTAAGYFYAPGKDLLMPTLDAVGLDRGTAAFRKQFHDVPHHRAYGDSRLGAR